MAVDTKEVDNAATDASEKIAQSSGDDTQKYAESMEAGADKLINQLNEQREETGKKAEEQIDDLNKNLDTEQETKKAEEEKEAKEEGKKEEKPDEKKEEIVNDEIKADETDTVEVLRDKLTKSEKRVKDTRKEFSNNKRDIKEKEIASQTIIENLNQAVFDLKTKAGELSNTKTVKEEKATEKEIAKKLINLDKQFETLKNVDPEIAEPLRQIIEGLQENYTSENTRLNTHITKLETELKNSTDTAQKSAQEIVDEKHYGKIEDAHSDWEAVVGSDEFNEYIDTLSPRQQVLAKQDLESGSAENIIELFSDYKTAVGITKKETTEEKNTDTKTNAKTEKLKAAANLVNPVLNKSKEIKTDGTKIKYTRSMIQAMVKNPVEYAKHEAAIDIELAAGRVVDDT